MGIQSVIFGKRAVSGVKAPCTASVSYTHLDVYKRQYLFLPGISAAKDIPQQIRMDMVVVLIGQCSIFELHTAVIDTCSRVAVPNGWKLPSGMPLMTPARCSACTAGRA